MEAQEASSAWTAQPRNAVGLAVGLGLLAAVLLWATVARVPWALSDSVAYVDAARGVLAGRGLVVRESPEHWVPLAHYPPLYPLLLAALMRGAGLSWLTAARILDAAMYGLFVAGLVWVGLRAFPRRPGWGLGLAAAVALQPAVLQHMSGVMTEPPFLALAVVTWAAAWAYGRTRRTAWWWVAVAAAALSLLVRYAGLYYLAALPAALMLAPLPRRVRIRRAAEAWAVLLATYGAWNLYMRAQGNGLQFAVPTAAEVLTKAYAFVAALPPAFWNGWVRWRGWFRHPWSLAVPWLLVGLSLAATLALARRARTRPPTPQAAAAQAGALAGAFGHLYAAFFFVASLVRRPEPDFTPRVMLPWFVFGLLAAGYALAVDLDARRRGWSPRARRALDLAWTAALVGFVLYALPQIHRFDQLLRDASYTGPQWRHPATWAFLRAWPQDIPLVTNAPEPILLWADRPAYRLQEFAQAMPVRGPLGYREAVDPNHRRFIAGQAAAVYMRPAWDWVRRLYAQRSDEVVDLLFRRYTPCYEDAVIELYYLGPQAERLCPLGPTEYHHPRR